MLSKFRQVALIGKYQSTGARAVGASSRESLDAIAHFLMDQGCEIVIEANTAANTDLTGYTTMDVAGIGASCDLALVVGGDGTMLGIGRQLAQYKVPLIGINQGRLGFITDIRFEQYKTTLLPMLAGHYELDDRSLMHARVMRDGHCVFSALAMNDVVVNRGATSGMVELRVEVDGNFVSNQRADGLIIATPTGSTAYSMSAGGPLLHPAIPGWVMVPIAPHTLSNRPIVLSNTARIAIEIVAGRDASANFDMQSLASLMHGDRIEVTLSEHRVRFLHPKGWTYFDTLRQKMHWNEGVA
ncbi:NAD kinase [Rhodoferax saidenbachensis]|uniref:NAD kinase n=1 Tax=Rhodoferax saidenbachensis TaxID=1484693 RepID=A0ABU1ZS09_9BURK|nr:NAD kinase [Rhodoferax saidenbachensis]MDR7308337.1 NAD+ kinase [Rhodoferax saidenbachensis]